MVFAVGRKNQLWVSLIEKALAKTYGNYAILKAGRTVEGLSTLTGSPTLSIDLEYVDLDRDSRNAALDIAIVHEAGHAVAAANSNVRVTGLGVFLFAIYPGAFTEVEPDQLERCSCAQRLRIFGAGIWHNIVLALLGVLILLLIPVLSLPFYSNSAGIVVVDVDPKSGLYGPTGLRAGHHIQRINQCEVRNASDWAACFGQIWETSRPHPAYQKGFLAQFKAVAQMTASNGHIIQDHSDGEVQCCNEFNVSNATHICFRYLAPLSADVQPSEGPSAEKQTTTPKPIFPKFPDFDAEFGVKSDGSALQHAQAVHLRRKRANLKMLRFLVTGQARPVLFIGYLDEPLHMVEVAELTPRFGLIPWWMPRVAELFARYLITLSLAMGILNAVPCYGLDGQFIGATVVDYFCQNWPLSVRKRMSNMLVTSGTVIFCSNILIGFARSLFNNH
uniref:Membrane-bound transcription factor site-2 protease n=1 Tax=Globodera pallida TaxID=36090 RepID=A0A183CH89_GLOPA